MSWASRLAQQLRRELPLEAPVDIEAFCCALGAELREEELPDGLLGLTVERGRRWIIVRAGLSPEERRLTVLHEGGHVLLHAGNGLLAARHDRHWGRRREREADEFAAVYGVPEELLTECRHELELTEAAGLPLAVVRRRLRLAGEPPEDEDRLSDRLRGASVLRLTVGGERG